MMPGRIEQVVADSVRNSPKPAPAKIWALSEPPFNGYHAPDPQGYEHSSANTAIVIDHGSSTIRAGWSFDAKPRVAIPPLWARYKDRKLNRYFTFIGSDVYSDGTARGQAKNIYEPGNNVVNNWDAVEGVLDYVFIKMGVDGNSCLDRPVVMTEPVANMGYTRKTMSELLFECYGATSVAYGIDSLFAYKHNGGRTGLVASSSYTSTTLIPVVNGKGMLTHATRLNWGRQQSADYLLKLLRLKYPTFPGKITDPQAEDLVRGHCYVSQNYQDEICRYLEWTGLEERSHVVQHPYTERIVIEKTEAELAQIAERKREGGRRLQEQAVKMRLKKLMDKEQELQYYRELRERINEQTNKKEVRKILDAEDFDDESQLDRRMKDLDKSITKARKKDLGEEVEDEVAEPPTFHLLEIPDDQLDEDQKKEKRQQRLMKSNHDARQRAKVEKEKEKARVAAEEQAELERRENDLEGWVDERRAARHDLIQKIKERDKMKADLGNRKSLANQMRMKTIASLASDNPTKKRRRGGDDDNFGADDADWAVYRQVQTGDASDDDDEEDLDAQLKKLEGQLLQHDPNFGEDSTREKQTDWTNSIVHGFLHGPYPFDPESQRDLNQIHLNVERIRVPEVVFQPSIAGLDQAGIVEIAAGILNERLADAPYRGDILKDIFLTGGNTLFQGFEERFRKELMAVLRQGEEYTVRRAKDPVLDAWRGAAGWAREAESKHNFVTRAEWAEKGGDYIKEHECGNTML